MNKITAIAKGFLSKVKLDSRVKRIQSAIEMAKLDLNDKRADVLDKMVKTQQDLAKDGTVSSCIQTLVNLQGELKTIDYNIEALSEVEKDLFSEVNEEDLDKKEEKA